MILENIDWKLISKEIASFSHFAETKIDIESNFEFKTEIEINHLLNQSDLFINNFEEYNKLHNYISESFPQENAAFSFINFLSKERILDISNIVILSRLIQSYFKCMTGLNELSILSSNIFEERVKFKSQKKITTTAALFFNEDNTINYNADSELKGFYHGLLSVESMLKKETSKILNNSKYKDALQFEGFDSINDKFVIPIRSDRYKRFMGRIITHSNSGQTLFVEPEELRLLSSKREEYIQKIDELIFKVRKQITTESVIIADEVNTIYKSLLYFDKLRTKSKYALYKNFSRPSISKNKKIKVQGLFHPLIADPVRNELDLQLEKGGLILSGPNTGGKTVLLKSFSLIYIFLHSGMYVPCKNAEISFVPEIFYLSSDNQDIEKGLSSFSSDLMQILDILKKIKLGSLIFIDEIFNSTSSEEASSLAYGFIKEIIGKYASYVIISTHHSLLKEKMYSKNMLESAHMIFDHIDSSPTYKISIGTPGSSMAFDIAKGIIHENGFSSKIIKNASDFLKSAETTERKLISEIEKKSNKLDELIETNKKINRDLKNSQNATRAEAGLLKEKILTEARVEAKRILSKAENLYEKVKKSSTISKSSFYKDRSEVINETRNKQEKERNISNVNLVPLEHLEKNRHYFSHYFSKQVLILDFDLKKSIIKISDRGKHISIPYNILQLSHEREKNYKKENLKNINVSLNINYDNLKDTIDCRGMRLEEFQTEVENALLGLRENQIPYLTVIHGHGDGILKKWLRKFLKNQKDLDWKPTDGNDGSTEISRS